MQCWYIIMLLYTMYIHDLSPHTTYEPNYTYMYMARSTQANSIGIYKIHPTRYCRLWYWTLCFDVMNWFFFFVILSPFCQVRFSPSSILCNTWSSHTHYYNFQSMAKPCEKKDEDNDIKEDAQAPDGGWGWIVLVG